jgi:hypothetical protein
MHGKRLNLLKARICLLDRSTEITPFDFAVIQ